MKVIPDKLPAQLDKSLAPVYIVSGDEPLLHMEACDAIRQAAYANGADEREVLEVESGFNWSRLNDTANTLSLFASKRLIEVRLGTQSPGQEGSKALERYASASPTDDILLVTTGRLDYRTQQSKWFKSLDNAGIHVPVWPIDIKRLPYWVSDRAKRYDFNCTSEAASALAQRYEGNLLALDQTLEKMRLLYPDATSLSIELIEEGAGDGARYDVFSLSDACVQGDKHRAIGILDGLKAEGTEAPILLWALTRELRTLLSLRQHVDQGQQFDHACKAQKPAIIERKRRAYQSACHRLPKSRLYRMLMFAQRIDLSIKGAADLPVWPSITDLVLTLAGGKGPLYEWPQAYRSSTA